MKNSREDSAPSTEEVLVPISVQFSYLRRSLVLHLEES